MHGDWRLAGERDNRIRETGHAASPQRLCDVIATAAAAAAAVYS